MIDGRLFFRIRRMKKTMVFPVVALFVLPVSFAEAEEEQSKTGPQPPLAVVLRDLQKEAPALSIEAVQKTLSVPGYNWRHGCGPTALGMVVGYYDGLGYENLIPGDASTQTAAVNAAIASGGSSSGPYPPGSEQHYEDYARPEDSYPTMLTDDYITSGRTAHANNCIADYMYTSQSTHSNYYGWSWSSDAGPAWLLYVSRQDSRYIPSFTRYYASSSLTWSVLVNEIDNNRPMMFLVDSDGNGSTDHFVTVVGYRDSPAPQYGCLDTWYGSTIRWENFTPMAGGTPWGISTGWSFILEMETYTLSLSKTGSGAVKVDDVLQSLPWTGVFDAGTEVILEAVPDAYWEFTEWSEDLTGRVNPTFILMDGDKDITANFESIPPDPDIDSNGKVNLSDLSFLAKQWMRADCLVPDWCGRTDLDMSGDVGLPDLSILAMYWLGGEE